MNQNDSSGAHRGLEQDSAASRGADVFRSVTSALLAAVDIWMIRRYHRRSLQQINSDRREMLEEQVALLRSRRNGHVE